jgi:hypothetical protein
MRALLADAVADRIETQRRLEFESLPEGWWAVAGLLLLAGAVAAVIWMYRRETRGGRSLRVRMVLAGVRSAVLLLLAGIWLEPVLATYLTRWVESYCLVLVDDSASMGLQDLYRDEQRAERVKNMLGEAPDGPVRRADLVRRQFTNGEHAFLRGLTANNRVRIVTFGDELQTFGTLPANREAKSDIPTDVASDQRLRFDAKSFLPAQGSRTDAAMALQRAVQQLSGAPIAGVVLVTDGGFTEADAYPTLASIIRERELRLHVVGVGDPAPPQNVRVVNVTAPESAFENDPFQIVAHLSATALEGQSISVNLYESMADGSGEPQRIETREVSIPADENLPPLTFTRARENKGRWIYKVEVPPGGFEAVTDDNVMQTTVSVIDSRIRVLLVSGNPSWEYRYLSRLLTRDETFDLSCWLQSADNNAVRDGNTIIDRLPAGAEQLFAYDVIVMLDPDPDELDRGWCELVNRLVSDYGGGLLYAAGRPYTPSAMHREELSPLTQLLPVRLDPSADLLLNRIGHYQKEAAGLLVPDEALSHPAMKMVDDPAGNRLAWQRLGDVFWHYPVLREKPVATVLFRHDDPRMTNTYGQHVLAATQIVGAGRAAFMAIDGTWRWRKYGEEVFDGFRVR